MNQGFRYTLEREKIAEYRKLTAEQKLQWLEEIRQFTEAALTEKTRRIRDHFRNGPTQKTIQSNPNTSGDNP
jgi:hypothetical protein